MTPKLQFAIAASTLSAIALLAATAPAQAGAKPPESPGPTCFQASTVSGWNRVDDKTVRVEVGGGRQFDLELMSTPPSSLFQEAIVLKAEPSGSVCTGNGLGVSVVTGGVAAAPSYQVVKVTQAPSVKEEREMRKKAKEDAAKAAGH